MSSVRCHDILVGCVQWCYLAVALLAMPFTTPVLMYPLYCCASSCIQHCCCTLCRHSNNTSGCVTLIWDAAHPVASHSCQFQSAKIMLRTILALQAQPALRRQSNFVLLIQACWDEEPGARPGFEYIIACLRGLLQQAASLRQASQALKGRHTAAPCICLDHAQCIILCSTFVFAAICCIRCQKHVA